MRSLAWPTAVVALLLLSGGCLDPLYEDLAASYAPCCSAQGRLTTCACPAGAFCSINPESLCDDGFCDPSGGRGRCGMDGGGWLDAGVEPADAGSVGTDGGLSGTDGGSVGTDGGPVMDGGPMVTDGGPVADAGMNPGNPTGFGVCCKDGQVTSCPCYDHVCPSGFAWCAQGRCVLAGERCPDSRAVQ